MKNRQKKSPSIRALVVSLVFLGSASLFIFLGWQSEERVADLRERNTLVEQADFLVEAISQRFALYENALRAGTALFDASDNVTREEWRLFANAIDLQEHYPGIQGYGYAVVVDKEDVDAFEASLQTEGFLDFQIKPTGDREVYTAITYLEPFDIRNQQAFGYDMFSNDVRRNAMEKARDSGQARLSGRVTLVQEIDEDVQAGFLLYVPQYTNGMPVNTIEERRAALAGYVYSPFRARDFMEGVIDDRLPVHFAVFDGDMISEATKIYDSHGQARNFDDPTVLAGDLYSQSVVYAGKEWTVVVNSSFAGGVIAHEARLRLVILGFTLVAVTIVAFGLYIILPNRFKFFAQ